MKQGPDNQGCTVLVFSNTHVHWSLVIVLIDKYLPRDIDN